MYLTAWRPSAPECSPWAMFPVSVSSIYRTCARIKRTCARENQKPSGVLRMPCGIWHLHARKPCASPASVCGMLRNFNIDFTHDLLCSAPDATFLVHRQTMYQICCIPAELCRTASASDIASQRHNSHQSYTIYILCF